MGMGKGLVFVPDLIEVIVTKTHADFQAAGLFNTINLFTLPPGGEIVTFAMNCTVTFAGGGGMNTYTIESGQAGDLDGILIASANLFGVGVPLLHKSVGADFFLTVAGAALQPIWSMTAATVIRATARSNVALSNSTGGSVTWYAKYTVH